ncbi:phosphoadenylyl-sulfate reductase [Deinococcus metallilatus]|uniref:Adenosine 5'-phosphosulfate reductase n=1 Tax=Deinococcus metallilatus TaxID=1211322 RepID=A0AAJ5F1S0_9DEIO|nr:phosphoadenylyl-sulfate reductase [Deinococcus metallilatus]MBB5296541.1 phosphoadenosine phosphosulfate reductase [Deinococcus metallilatus]QBY08431.1 phosphoadenylyl-sulfate reductase [Deinococcus metallilatus]RXJ11230.1 phosphoadenylyl-sulfate reductase [Deinococcus metallilatus]TLK24721.1 phosphoadenylyl-sulfate reductase [Deinococcus metallilatus]GMA17459.1 phosphoadenosine phosphosulfate reductase [Deinococcus metallilatus]
MTALEDRSQASRLTQPGLPTFTPDTDPLDVIRCALAAHPDLLMPSAFNLNGVVLLDLAARAGYRGEVVFVDTGFHFPETLATRDCLAARYPEMTFVTLNAGAHPEDGQTPPDLYASDPDACCAVRKVAPLQAYLREKAPSALLNARSRDQATTRADIPFVEAGGARVKINPLAHWTRERLEAYAREHDLPVNPLYWDGFLSIGCWTCTRAVRPGEDARAGRWAGKGKTECGLWAGGNAL